MPQVNDSLSLFIGVSKIDDLPAQQEYHTVANAAHFVFLAPMSAAAGEETAGALRRHAELRSSCLSDAIRCECCCQQSK
jgi:hypothetical protein